MHLSQEMCRRQGISQGTSQVRRQNQGMNQGNNQGKNLKKNLGNNQRMFQESLKRVSIGILSLLIVACASNERKGDNMMEAEQWDKAVEFYQLAANRSPGDEDIAAKLFEARTKLVAADLIKVRQLRQGNQRVPAAELLNDTLGKMKAWTVRADSGVKETIEEESRQGAKWLSGQLAEAAGKQNHNQFAFLHKRYDQIMATGFSDSAYRKHLSAMKSLGQKQCKDLANQVKRVNHFVSELRQGYCSYWGVSSKDNLQADKSRFKGVQWKNNRLSIAKRSGVTFNQFSKAMNSEVTSSLWFDQSSNNILPMNLSGAIDYAYSKKKTTFSQTYVTYKEYYKYEKDPENPKKKKKKLDKKVPVEKTDFYDGLKHTEVYSYRIEAKGSISSHSIAASGFQPRKEKVDHSHQHYFKKEGISPKRVKLLDKSSWVNGMQSDLKGKIKSRLDQAWRDEFCGTGKQFKFLSDQEYSLRCGAIDQTHPKADGWAKQYFELSYQQLKLVSGI